MEENNMIGAREAREKVETFSKNSLIAFTIYLSNQNRGDILSKAISERASEGYSSYSFQVPSCYRAAIEPYFEAFDYKVVVIPNIADDALVDIDIFW
jgi:hypothetical protein